MSFLFESIAIPLWFIAFIAASAAPLWLKWYKRFHVKYIVTGVLKRKLGIAKSDDEIKSEILKKANDHWTATSEMEAFKQSKSKSKPKKKTKRESDPARRENIIKVLKALAEQGEIGALPKTISDNSGVKTLDTTNALSYLVEKKYAEIINSSLGAKYYLTRLGRQYCANKKIIT
jgi:hypothetical protein